MNDWDQFESGMSPDLLDTASGIEPAQAQAQQNAMTAVQQGGTLQRTGTGYSTAIRVQEPRNLQQRSKMLMAEARMAGESFYYGWGSGKNRVTGPSVGLAMAAARVWGNCAVDMQPIQDLPDSWIMTAQFVDLETGFTSSRQFRQSKKWTVHGKHDAERKDDMRFQIGQSKATRNVVLASLPKWLIEAALREAQAGVRDRIERYVEAKGLPAAVDVVMGSLKKEGVSEEAILAKCEVPKIEGLTIEHVVMLRGDLYALQEGQERAEILFPSMAAGAGSGPNGPKRSKVDEQLDNAEVGEREVVPEAEKVARAQAAPEEEQPEQKPPEQAPGSEPEQPAREQPGQDPEQRPPLQLFGDEVDEAWDFPEGFEEARAAAKTIKEVQGIMDDYGSRAKDGETFLEMERRSDQKIEEIRAKRK